MVDPQRPSPPPVLDPQDGCADAPAGLSTNPTPAGATHGIDTWVPTRAMEDVLKVRWDQIHTFGHTPEKDAAQSLKSMFWIAGNFVLGLRDHVQTGTRTAMRTYAVKAAAALLAFIDRLDMEDS